MRTWFLLIILIILAAVVAFLLKGFLPGGNVVKLRNASDYDISPGVIVLHADSFSMNYLGLTAPAAYQTLAEVGDPSALKELLEGTTGVYRVVDVGHLKPRSEEKIMLRSLSDESFPEDLADIRMSYMGMIVQTNDGVAWINSIPLEKVFYQQDGDVDPNEARTYWTEILDMGSEENSPIGSGFAGGQPDPSRGAENIENGTATEEPVNHHVQFYNDSAVSTYVLGFIRAEEPAEEPDDAGN